MMSSGIKVAARFRDNDMRRNRIDEIDSTFDEFYSWINSSTQ